MRKRIISVAALAVSASLLFSGCAGGSGDADAAAGGSAGDSELGLPIGEEPSTEANPELTALLPEEIQESGVLKMGSEFPYPPMADLNEDNRAVGYDPELVRALAQKLGVEAEIIKQPFSTAIPGLQAGKIDVYMGGMTDTPERQETLSFVNYLFGGFKTVAMKGNPEGLSTLDDLCGLNVAVGASTVQGDILRSHDCGDTPVNVVEYPTDADVHTAVRAGRAVAFVTDGFVAEWLAENTNDGEVFEVVRDPEAPAGFSPVYAGIGILKEDEQLVEALQAALQELIEEGTYQEILDRNGLSDFAVESAEINQGKAL
ncbi:ABC transporter substrate-binding protein [Gulosibacter molinativorax]|nr:ABC transporter substrate-binding protein [Gulosibacter molinativorax]